MYVIIIFIYNTENILKFILIKVEINFDKNHY